MTWIPSDLKKTIILIGEKQPNSAGAQPKGSGVLIKHKGNSYVVTAKHVIEKINNPIFIVDNKKGGILLRSTQVIREKFGCEWINHPNDEVDLSIFHFITYRGVEDLLSVEISDFRRFIDIVDGDDVFFMGFPLGLTQSERITPLIRQGCVALKFDLRGTWQKVTYASKTILIDGNISAGNSGSPIFSKPTIMSPKVSLYGIITSHLTSPIYDFGGLPIGRENAGLGIASSIDHIIDLLDIL